MIEGVSVAPNWSTENYDKYLNALWLDVGTTRKTNGRIVLYYELCLLLLSVQQRVKQLSVGWLVRDGQLLMEV